MRSKLETVTHDCLLAGNSLQPIEMDGRCFSRGSAEASTQAQTLSGQDLEIFGLLDA